MRKRKRERESVCVCVFKKKKKKKKKKTELLNGCYICLSPSSTSYNKLS